MILQNTKSEENVWQKFRMGWYEIPIIGCLQVFLNLASIVQ